MTTKFPNIKKRALLYHALVLSLCLGIMSQSNQTWAGRRYLRDAPVLPAYEALHLSPIQQKAPLDKIISFRPSINEGEDVLENDVLKSRPKSDPLKAVKQKARRQSYGLKAAQKEKEAAHQEVYRSYSRFLPKINGLVSRDWVREENSFSRPTSDGTKPRFFQEDKANISVTLPLITGGRTLYGLRKSQAAQKAANANLMATGFALELEAAQAYLSVIKDRQIEASLKTAKHALSQTLHATKMRHKAGDASRTDVALASAALSAMTGEYYNAQMQSRYSEATLASLIQRQPKTQMAKPRPVSRFTISVEAARKLVLTRNPTLNMAFHNAQIAKHTIGIERAAALPQLSLSGRYAVERQEQDDYKRKDSFEKDYRFGFNLQVPLLDAESLIGVKVSRSNAAAQYYKALDTRRKILTEFEADWQRFALYHHKKQAQAAQISALKQAVIGMEYEYKAGLRSITDILSAQVNQVRAQVSLAQTDFEGHILHQRILLATGKAKLNRQVKNEDQDLGFIIP